MEHTNSAACEAEYEGCRADIALSDHSAVVIGNVQVDDRLYIMELQMGPSDGPAESTGGLAACIKPGQFVHMSIPTLPNHILRRPFSIYAVDAEHDRVEILYQAVGAGTAEMTKWLPGQRCTMIGPIGRGWTAPERASRVLLVGAGVGAAPLFMLYEELAARGLDVEVVLGATSASALVCKDRYCSVCGCEPNISTDDGTLGYKGFCTEVAADLIDAAAAAGDPFDQVYVCGPEPVMRIVSAKCADAGLPCQVSLEKRMACGIGACLSCVVNTTSGKKRSCVDGPVFDAKEVLW